MSISRLFSKNKTAAIGPMLLYITGLINILRIHNKPKIQEQIHVVEEEVIDDNDYNDF